MQLPRWLSQPVKMILVMLVAGLASTGASHAASLACDRVNGEWGTFRFESGYMQMNGARFDENWDIVGNPDPYGGFTDGETISFRATASGADADNYSSLILLLDGDGDGDGGHPSDLLFNVSTANGDPDFGEDSFPVDGTSSLILSVSVPWGDETFFVEGSVTCSSGTPSTDATLAGLAVDAGVLDPAFVPGTTRYDAEVPHTTGSIRLTPTAAHPGATITVNGTGVVSGGTTDAISLAFGANTITVEVTAESGATQAYTVNIVRQEPPSTDATLSALTVSAGVLDPAFATGILGYDLNVANATTSIVVTPSASDGGAAIEINGIAVVSGEPSGAIPLNVGPNAINVAVTAASGATQTYTITVTRAEAASFVWEPASGTVLPQAMAGEGYAFQIAASGGVGTTLYEQVDGALPDGLVLNVSTGELTGPLDAGTEGQYSFTLEVRDTNGDTARADYTLTVVEQAVTATDHEIAVNPGTVPANVDLADGATGGPFLDAVIVSVEPAHAGEARIVDTQYAQAAGGPTPPRFFLRFAPNPAFSGKARVNYRLVSALGTSNVGTVTYTLSFDAAAVVKEIDQLTRGFVQTRQNLIASSIKIPGLLERRRMDAASGRVASSLSPLANGLALNFSASLSSGNAAVRAIEAQTGEETYASPFNVWTDGTLTIHHRPGTGDRWGSFGMISAGADYLINDKALVGLSFHYDRMADPVGAGGQFTGDGWLAGPYASFEIGSGVFWDTSLLYGGSANRIDTTFWDGIFDTRRWLFDTAISGQWELGAATVFTPKLQAVYLNEQVVDYWVANGAGSVLAIGGFVSEQLRLSIGAEIEHQVTLDNGATLTPKFGLTGGMSGLERPVAFGQISAGLSFEYPQSWTLNGNVLLNLDGNGQVSVGTKVGLSRSF